jgi:uncharacterized protein YigE (DUF2233 family)
MKLCTTIRGRLSAGVLTGLVTLVFAIARTASADAILWDHMAPGLEVTLWVPSEKCGNDVPLGVMVRVDPERFQFQVYHYRDEGLSGPLTIQEWQQRTRANVLFNAGLFREDYSYMGLLLKGGRSVGSKRHPQWHGLFVAEPIAPGLKKARVLDLARESFAEDRPPYREAAQSLMLLDQAGQPRVRRSGRRDYQMVVAEDQQGRILLIRPGKVVALWELAQCLHESLPDVVQAMAMDGGSSSELYVGPGTLKRAPSGTASKSWSSLLDGSGVGHVPLPSVIGVLTR